MSVRAQKNLKRAIRWMDAFTPFHYEKNPQTGKKFKMKLNFITLTLCAPQMHSDVEIKREMLHPWLTNIVKRFKLKSYVWRAEPQENGNIHFHFVTNKFMNLYVIRRAWNACQKRMGYIEKYRTEQKEFHKNGFTPRPWLYKVWTKEKQLIAYNKGVTSNWSDPNSTDVHSLQNVENVAAYVSKYMCKTVTGICPECKKKHYFNEKPTEEMFCKKCSAFLDLKIDRKITGRLWFISQSLSKIKACRIANDGYANAELYVANGFKEEGIECSPYANLFLIRPDKIPIYAGLFIKTAYQKYLDMLYRTIELGENAEVFETESSFISPKNKIEDDKRKRYAPQEFNFC